MSLAQHACANIQHKAFVGMFVPHNRLLQTLEGLTLFPNNALRHSKQGVDQLAPQRQLMSLHPEVLSFMVSN